MSNKNDYDASHPQNMSQEDLQKSLALLDDEGDGEAGADTGAVAGADAGGAGDAGAAGAAGAGAGEGTDAGAGADTGEAGAAAGGAEGAADAGAVANAGGAGAGEAGAGGEAGAAAGAGAAAAAAGAGAGAGAGDDDKVDRKAFNGLLADLRATREEVKTLRAQQAAPLALAPPDARDFKAEKAALREKWDAGDMDTDDYNDQRDALTVAEARYGAALEFHTREQARQQQAIESDWNKAITGWQTANADFLANPLRANAVSQVLDALERDPATAGLSNEDLIKRAEEIAFDAYNWKREPAQAAVGADVAPDPRAVAAARSASAASATPPLPGRGAGSALTAGQVKLEELKPGEFGKLPASVQRELLGEEG